MSTERNALYVQPVLVKHELLRDITAARSGHGNNGYGNGGSKYMKAVPKA